jgi:hypothetical protein
MNAAEQIATRAEAGALMVAYESVIHAAAQRASMDVVLQNINALECAQFLASWDGPGVTRDDLVRYAVDWLTNP